MKKLAFISICLACFNVDAASSPFGVNIGADVRMLNPAIIDQHNCSTRSDIPGYVEISMNTDYFVLDNNKPSQAKIYFNKQGAIEALVVSYTANNANKLIENLDTKYKKTYSRQTFYGSYDVEYHNGNCLIRIVKPFVGNTTLMYGTEQWFNAYDKFCGQSHDILQKRQEFANSQINPLSGSCKLTQESRPSWSSEVGNAWNFDGPKKLHHNIRNKRSKPSHPEGIHKPFFGNAFEDAGDVSLPEKHRYGIEEKRPQMPSYKPTRHSGLLFDDIWNFDVFDSIEQDMRAMNERMNAEFSKIPADNVKVHKESHSYSKSGDTEEWIHNDNGKITHIKKTPQGTVVTHDADDSDTPKATAPIDDAGNMRKTIIF